MRSVAVKGFGQGHPVFQQCSHTMKQNSISLEKSKVLSVLYALIFHAH